jgi:hypothetical protein
VCRIGGAGKGSKVFCFFFFKKEGLAFAGPSFIGSLVL